MATGEAHSVREFIELAFAEVGRTIRWQGEGINEVGIETCSGKDLVRVDRRYFRPTEVDALLGDASKAAQRLGWRHETSFQQLITEMVQSDLKDVASRPGRKSHQSH